jgi:hypothetical protein
MVVRISHKHLKFHLGIENAFTGCTKSINSTIEVRDFKTPALFAGNAFYANLRQQICKKNDQRLIAKKARVRENFILFCKIHEARWQMLVEFQVLVEAVDGPGPLT